MKDMSTEESWNFFMEKNQHCINNFVPVRKSSKTLKNQSGWTNIVLGR